MDPDEEAQHAADEAERERHWEALERSKRQSSAGGSFISTAGSMIRTWSVSTSECWVGGLHSWAMKDIVCESGSH